MELKSIDLEPGDTVRVRVADIEREGRKVIVKLEGGGLLTVPTSAELDCRRTGGASAGGEKGEAIQKALRRAGAKGVAPSDVAERVGCHVNRVYEVLRGVDGVVQVSRGRYAIRVES